jgi:regulator of replication initiation timing
MSIFRKKGEQPTAKDSKIEELTAEVKQLRQEYLKSLEQYNDLLRENKKLLHDLSMLRIELSDYDTREEKKTLNLNTNYDGIHQY